MPNYKLLYFDARALAEPIRIMFAMLNVPYEDYRVSVEEWSKLKPTTPFGQLPILQVDGEQFGQSMSITRYLARKFEMAPKTIFITGANRGIGLGLVRELLKVPGVEALVAGARNIDGAKELQSLAKADARLHLIAVDVSNDGSLENSVKSVSGIVGDRGLNLLINNAGLIESYGTTSAPNRASVLHCIDVNAVSALLASQHFLPLLQKAASHVSGDSLTPDRAAIVNIGSDCASQALNLRGSGPSNSLLAYKMSKVAMLSFSRSMAADFKRLEIPVLITNIHPGWVQTDMGGSNAEISVDESVTKIVASIAKLNGGHQGGLFNRELEEMPL